MGEALGKIPKGDTSWILTATAKPDVAKKKETKEDTLFNTFLQEVLDVATPIVQKEQREFAEINGKIALHAAEELNKNRTLWEKILVKDKQWRGRDVPKRLARLLVFGLIGSAAFGLDRSTDILAEKAFSRIKDEGNRAALTKGWEMLTDMLSGKLVDTGARLGTNKDTVGFVTPVSSALGQVGNTVLTMLDNKSKIWNSLVNPGVIESGFRAINAIPLVGAGTEKLYAIANKELLEQDGTFPFIFSMAFNMMLEKETHKQESEKPVEVLKKRKNTSRSGGGPRR